MQAVVLRQRDNVFHAILVLIRLNYFTITIASHRVLTVSSQLFQNLTVQPVLPTAKHAQLLQQIAVVAMKAIDFMMGTITLTVLRLFTGPFHLFFSVLSYFLLFCAQNAEPKACQDSKRC